MRVVESSDGTVKVIELDPSKSHWIICDEDALDAEQIRNIRMRDGTILLKHPGRTLTVVEGGADGSEVREAVT